jgi:hypothetical protein
MGTPDRKTDDVCSGQELANTPESSGSESGEKFTLNDARCEAMAEDLNQYWVLNPSQFLEKIAYDPESKYFIITHRTDPQYRMTPDQVARLIYGEAGADIVARIVNVLENHKAE